MKGILASVGKAAKNIRKDVVLVQELLNNKIQLLAGAKKLRVDGLCGNKTISLILRYQEEVLGMKKPDGRVDPGGRTFKSLYSHHRVPPGKHVPEVTRDYWKGDSSRWSQEKKLQSLNTAFRTKLKAVLEELDKAGYKPKIFYGWRSEAVQLDLYNKKRSKVKFSFHNATGKDGVPNAYAADIIDSRYAWSDKPETTEFWKALGQAAKKQGLYWGGDWKSFKDWAHIQFYPNSQLNTVYNETRQLNK